MNTSLVLFSFLLFFLAHLFYSFFFHFSQAHVWIFTRPTAIRNYTHCCKFYSERDKHIVVNCFYHLKKQNYIPKIIPKIAISYIYIYYIYILYMYIYVCLYIYICIYLCSITQLVYRNKIIQRVQHVGRWLVWIILN